MKDNIKNDKNKKLLGNARLNRLGNDLFWEYNYFDENDTFHMLRWTGYDDAYWWNEVEPELAKKIRVDNGKSYMINYETLEVFEVIGGDKNE